MLQRQQLRQLLTTKRRALDLATQQLAAQQLVANIINTSLFLKSHHIAAYHAVNGEISPAPLLQTANIQNKKCYLPVLNVNYLRFAAYKPSDLLKPNCFNIPEPAPIEMIEPTQLDLLLVPLIAFDLQGNRLGTGGGYYDRTFAFLQSQQRPTKPYLLGIAYDWQRIDHLPAESWDVPLDGIATDKNFYTVS